MKKVLSLVLVAVMIMTLSSSAIYAAPNNNPNASFNRNRSAFENKVKDNKDIDIDAKKLKEQLRFTMLHKEGLPYGIGKRLDNLPPGLEMLFKRGTMPHGLAKRLMDSYYPLPGEKTELEVLKALIATANIKAEAADAEAYKGGEATIKALEDAIVVAETFVAGYVETQEGAIAAQVNNLKTAMKTFDNLKYMTDQEIVSLKVIELRLNEYQDNYESYLDTDEKLELQTLINFIGTFTRAVSPVELTKGDYDSILLQEKAFKDPLVSLYVKIDEAKVMLYVDVENPDDNYKVTIGNEPGEYLSAGVLGLHDAIDDAEAFVEDHTSESEYNVKVEVKKQVDALELAIDTFKDSEILGADEKAILNMTLDQLEDYLEENQTVALVELIAELELFLNVPNVLTVGIYNDFMDRSQVYIDGLYAYMIDEIDLLIEASLLLLNENEPFDLAEETALYDKVVEVDEYLSTVVKYNELVTHYSELNVLFQALQDVLAE